MVDLGGILKLSCEWLADLKLSFCLSEIFACLLPLISKFGTCFIGFEVVFLHYQILLHCAVRLTGDPRKIALSARAMFAD